MGKKVPTRRRIQNNEEQVTPNTVMNNLNNVVQQQPSTDLSVEFPQQSDHHLSNVIASVEAMHNEDAMQEIAEESSEVRNNSGGSQNRKIQLNQEWTEGSKSLVEALLKSKGFRAQCSCMKCWIALPNFHIQCVSCTGCSIICTECDLKIHFLNPLHERVLNYDELQLLPRILLPREVVNEKGSVYERGELLIIVLIYLLKLRRS